MFYNNEKKMSELNDIKTLLNITDWEKVMILFPSGTPSFLTPEEYLNSAEFCELNKEIFPSINKTAALTLADPVLLQLSWYLYWKMYMASERLNGAQSKLLPDFTSRLGELNGTFYLLIALGIIPFMRSYHKHLGIPENITKDTARIISSLVESYRRGTDGKTGVFSRPIYWLQNYIHGNLYLGIGRFCYWAKPYSDRLPGIYRNKKNKKIVAFAPSDMLFNSDGYCDLAEEQIPEADYWRSTFRIDENTVTGNPFLPCGKAVKETITLSLSEWDCVFGKGSAFLDLHIPAGGNMSLDVCKDSLTRAADFFSKKFPDLKPAAVICNSWICSPNLSEFMPESSNLIKFQKECFLYPKPSPRKGGLWFFFFQDTFDPLTAPRHSSLQRAIAEHLESGHDLREGGMLILFDDLQNFGSQKYWENADSLSKISTK